MWPLLAVTLVLLASFGLHVYLFRLNCQNNAESASRFVSIEDYNNLVRAQNKLTTLITNQQTLFSEHQTELTRLAQQYDHLDGACVRSGSLAELYVKMSEYEERLRERMADGENLQARMESLIVMTNRLESLPAQSVSLTQVSNKVDALQRAFIRLSLGFQDFEAVAKPRE